MGRSAAEIVSLYLERKQSQGKILETMRQVRDQVNGDVVVPLPELDRNEKAAVANLVGQGLDQMGMRIGSTMPDLFFPPDRPGIKASEELARTRRSANLAWWDTNALNLKMRRRARHMVGYGSTPVILRPDKKLGMPRWDVRDPLSTFAASSSEPDDMVPEDCIFVFQRNLGWVRRTYPESYAVLSKGRKNAADMFDILEYVDDFEHVLIVVGKPQDPYAPPGDGAESAVELERFANLTGRCPVVIPGRISLDRQQGQYDGVLGMYAMSAKLMALEVIATERGVFPDTYVVARQGENPQLIAPADGRRGIIGEIKGGELRDVATNPGFMTNPVLDRLERALRLTSGTPADFGGESGNNVRTGRRGEQLLSAVVDFPVQEAHELFARSLREENQIAFQIDRAYFGAQKKTYYVAWRGAKGRVDYKPLDTWLEGQTAHTVQYSQAGSDVNGLAIAAGQRVGMGTLSKQSFMEMDPLVDDAELEHDRGVSEALEGALLASIQERVGTGTIAPTDVAKIMLLVKQNKFELADAVMKVDEEAKERQATEAPEGSPETMPGLADPGVGAEQPAAIEGPNPSQEGLSQLLGALRRPQMQLASEG